MAHNARVRADLAAWGAAIPVEPEEFNYLDEGVYNSINGDGGGTWAPAAAIIVGGSGLHLSGANHHVLGGATLAVDSGGTFTVAANGTLNINTGAYGYINGTGYLTVNTGAAINIASGGFFRVTGDAVIQNTGNLIVESGGAIDVKANGAINVESTGDINIQGGADINVANAGDINIEGGGAINIEGGGDITVANGGTITVQSGGELTLAAGAVVSVAAVAPRTGAGRIPKRIIRGEAVDDTTSYGPQDADVVIIYPWVGANDRGYTLDHSLAVHGDVIKFVTFDPTYSVTITPPGSTIFYGADVPSPLVLRDSAGSPALVMIEFTWSDGTGAYPQVGWWVTDYIRSV